MFARHAESGQHTFHNSQAWEGGKAPLTWQARRILRRPLHPHALPETIYQYMSKAARCAETFSHKSRRTISPRPFPEPPPMCPRGPPRHGVRAGRNAPTDASAKVSQVVFWGGAGGNAPPPAAGGDKFRIVKRPSEIEKKQTEQHRN